jgi:sugar O-acyltransferase (sialic acid O-acetyltransferase NeuD family)
MMLPMQDTLEKQRQAIAGLGPPVSKSIFIYGAGGFARELRWLLENSAQPGCIHEFAGFIDDRMTAERANKRQIGAASCTLASAYSHQSAKDYFCVCGIGDPENRQRAMWRAMDAGFRSLCVIHNRAEIGPGVMFGDGAIVCAGNIITVDVKIGKHVLLNLDCTVGHDVRIGDYSVICPGVHISGCVEIGQKVFIGTGANIIHGTAKEPLTIGDGAVIGAGACVTKSVPAHTRALGVPARW